MTQVKQIPIDLFFKYRQEPIFIVNLKLSYKELIDKYPFEYEVWQEDGLGDLVGAAMIVGEHEYFLKASKDHFKPYSQIAVLVQASTENLEQATEIFLSSLNICHSEVDHIGKYFYGDRWQLVRETQEDSDVVVNNFKSESEALGVQKYIQTKYGGQVFVRKYSGIMSHQKISKQALLKYIECWQFCEKIIQEKKDAYKIILKNGRKSMRISMPYEVAEFYVDFEVDDRPYFCDWYEIMDESLASFMSYTRKLVMVYLYQEVRVIKKECLFKTRELQYNNNGEWCNLFDDDK